MEFFLVQTQIGRSKLSPYAIGLTFFGRVSIEAEVFFW